MKGGSSINGNGHSSFTYSQHVNFDFYLWPTFWTGKFLELEYRRQSSIVKVRRTRANDQSKIKKEIFFKGKRRFPCGFFGIFWVSRIGWKNLADTLNRRWWKREFVWRMVIDATTIVYEAPKILTRDPRRKIRHCAFRKKIISIHFGMKRAKEFWTNIKTDSTGKS